MALPPIDLSPFRMLINFFAGSYVALVSLVVTVTSRGNSQRNWVEFADPDIGAFGLNGPDWMLPAGADAALAYGYHAFSGNDESSLFGTLNLVNIAKTLADHPDTDRTHIAVDYVFEKFLSEDVGRTGFIRCEVYRGPPLAEIIAHLDDEVYAALGSTEEAMRTAFQYRRDGVVGRLGEFEQAITVDAVQRRMRIRIPVVGEDHTPAFELI